MRAKVKTPIKPATPKSIYWKDVPERHHSADPETLGYLRWLFVRKRAHVNNKKRKGYLDWQGNPVEFRFTFGEWLDLFLEEDKHLRYGQGDDDLVLSRKNDLGHYERGNVVLTEKWKNDQEGAERWSKMCAEKKGL